MQWDVDKLNGGTGNQAMEPPAMYGQIPYPPNDEAWMVQIKGSGI